MKTLTAEYLATAEAEINQLIWKTYLDDRDIPEGDRGDPILDGVVNIPLYLEGKHRVMWFLKEPVDGENSSGGGWSMCRHHLDVEPVAKLSWRTFRRILYINYGIEHGVFTWREIPEYHEIPDAERCIRSMAFINAKKLPGVTRGTRPGVIMAWFEKAKAVLLRQINDYAPNIVFGCNPHLPMLLRELNGGKMPEMQHSGSAAYVWLKSRLYIHVYHPAQTKITQEKYVDDALAAYRGAMASASIQ